MNQPTQTNRDKRQFVIEWQTVFLNKLGVAQTRKDTLFDVLDTVRELQEIGSPIRAVCQLLAERLRTCSDSEFKAEQVVLTDAARLAGLLDRLSIDYYIFNNETDYTNVSEDRDIKLEEL